MKLVTNYSIVFFVLSPPGPVISSMKTRFILLYHTVTIFGRVDEMIVILHFEVCEVQSWLYHSSELARSLYSYAPIVLFQ